ncbi:MAG: hypothetical protein O2999_11770 [Nitrospirae bacterium]|nr:hypothetical protein [Nitrospirota bacterium]MDA1304954.1 hypothetical protein [Nitrospirota bacterium]
MKTKSLFTKTATVFVGGTVVLLACLPSESWACHEHPNPIAFQHPLTNESDLLPNGMMAVIYKHEGEEEVVHVTVHRIHMIMAGYHPMLPEKRDPQYTVLQTNGTLSPMTYVILANPLFYGTGRDAIGFPTKTWIDPNEDGLNGNEQATFRTAKPKEQMTAQAPLSP